MGSVMVVTAKQYAVIEVGLSAMLPGLQMMRFGVARVSRTDT